MESTCTKQISPKNGKHLKIDKTMPENLDYYVDNSDINRPGI